LSTRNFVPIQGLTPFPSLFVLFHFHCELFRAFNSSLIWTSFADTHPFGYGVLVISAAIPVPYQFYAKAIKVFLMKYQYNLSMKGKPIPLVMNIKTLHFF